VKWLEQENAVEDLRMISQPRWVLLRMGAPWSLLISKFSDMDLEKIKDFVYDAKAGEGILVYVVDRGVQINVKNVSIRQPFASWRFWHWLSVDRTTARGSSLRRPSMSTAKIYLMCSRVPSLES
jgi:hypothetical protein